MSDLDTSRRCLKLVNCAYMRHGLTANSKSALSMEDIATCRLGIGLNSTNVRKL
jgi:hypothetical protein